MLRNPTLAAHMNLIAGCIFLDRIIRDVKDVIRATLPRKEIILGRYKDLTQKR